MSLKLNVSFTQEFFLPLQENGFKIHVIFCESVKTGDREMILLKGEKNNALERFCGKPEIFISEIFATFKSELGRLTKSKGKFVISKHGRKIYHHVGVSDQW